MVTGMLKSLLAPFRRQQDAAPLVRAVGSVLLRDLWILSPVSRCCCHAMTANTLRIISEEMKVDDISKNNSLLPRDTLGKSVRRALEPVRGFVDVMADRAADPAERLWAHTIVTSAELAALTIGHPFVPSSRKVMIEAWRRVWAARDNVEQANDMLEAASDALGFSLVPGVVLTSKSGRRLYSYLPATVRGTSSGGRRT
jgi:hypothetical protein